MEQFVCTFWIRQINPNNYEYSWDLFEYAGDRGYQLVDNDWDINCDTDTLYGILKHYFGFNTEVVSKYFEEHPYSEITLQRGVEQY
jgi:hypothetical protein